MRLRLAAAAAALLAACGPSKSSPHTTTQRKSTPPAACANAVRAPLPLPDGWVQDLGTLAVGSDASFVVTAGTAAFFIVPQEVGSTAVPTVTFLPGTPSEGFVPNSVVPSNVRSPDGTVFYDDVASFQDRAFNYRDLTGKLAWDGGFQSVVSVFGYPTTSAGLGRFQSDGSQVAPGTWSFRLEDWAHECPTLATQSPWGCADGSASGEYHVYVVTRPPATQLTLDVEVYLATRSTSPSGLTSATAANASARATRWRSSLDWYLQRGGISLGTVTFHDLPADVKTRYAPNGSIDITDGTPCGDLSQLFTFANDTNPQAVRIFLADALVEPSQGNLQTVGIDGSIPGPSGFAGVVSGGAVVGLADFTWVGQTNACSGAQPSLYCGVDVTAIITAHEIGHWLGLFHTTEADGTLFDPISDTSTCRCDVCASSTQAPRCSQSAAVLFNSDCTKSSTCGGGDNLMFWLLDAGNPGNPSANPPVPARPWLSTGVLTAHQSSVIQRNPAVR